MQIKVVISCFLLLFPAMVWGQSCYDYPCVIRKVKDALAAKNYQSAFNNLESAAAYPGSVAEEIAGLRQQLFHSIQQEKEEAEKERKRAEQAESQVRTTLKIVQQERDRSETLRKAAEKNGEINRLTAQAMEVQTENPSLAADLAHYAFELSGRQHPLAAKIRRNLYQDPNVLLQTTTLVGHQQEINALAFSPDGQYVLTGSRDKTAILWERSGRILQYFVGHTSSVTQVAFTPDGRQVVTGSADYTLKLWDLDGQVQQTFSGHNRSIRHITFSTDGRLMLSCTYDGLKLWDLTGQEKLGSFAESNTPLEAISFMDDDQMIVGVNTYGDIMKWDLNGKLLDRVDMSIDNLLIAAFSRDGARLLVNSIGGKTLLWDTKTNRKEREMADHAMFRAADFSSVDGHILIARSKGTFERWELSGKRRGPAQSMGSQHALIKAAFSSDGSWMATISQNNTATIWDLSGRTPLRLGGHQTSILSMAVAPDGHQILTGSADGEIISWTADGKKRWSATCYAGEVRTMAFAPDGETFALGSELGQVEIRTKKGVLLSNFQGTHYRTGYVWTLAFSPDGRQLLISTNGGNVEMIDLDTGQSRSLSIPDQESEVYSLAFSPNGTEILLGGLDGIAWLCNSKGEVLKRYEADTDRSINALCFSPDGKNIVVAKGAIVYLWDREGNLLTTLEGYERDIKDLAISPDGQYILTGGYSEEAKLWDIKGQLLQDLDGHTGGVHSVDFRQSCASCPMQLLTAGEDQTAMIWNLDGQRQQLLGGHPASILAVAVSPDGQLMATAGKDTEVRLWDQAGNLTGTIPGHEWRVESIAFSPDNQMLLSSSFDKIVRLWDLNGRLLQSFGRQDKNVTKVRFFPNGQSILTVGGSELQRWDVQGDARWIYEAPFNIAGMDLSPNGTTIALTGGDGKVILLDSDGKLVRQFQVAPYPNYDLAFSPNGHMLLLGTEMNGALLIDLKGKIIRGFDPSGPINSLAFAPVCESCTYDRGQLIATGGSDGALILWDIQGVELQRFQLDNASITHLVFTPDGSGLLVGKDDQTAVLIESIESYFSNKRPMSYAEGETYGIPFDFQQVQDPGLILDYGLRYLQLDQEGQELSLAKLDAARLVMEHLVNRYGMGYRIYLSEVLYNYARFHFRKGQFTEAVKAYQKVLDFDPSAAWLELELATTWLFAGDWEPAKAIYDRRLGQKWDQAVSSYGRTWDEAFYKYLEQAATMATPKNEALVKKARNYLLEVMSQ